MFDGLATSFRSLKLRPRQAKCAVCGTAPTINEANFARYDYEGKCGGPMHDKGGEGLCLLHEGQRVSCEALKRRLDERRAAEAKGDTFLLVDVRPPAEFAFASLAGSVNVPVDEIEGKLEAHESPASSSAAEAGPTGSGSAFDLIFGECVRRGTAVEERSPGDFGSDGTQQGKPRPVPRQIFVVCRRGNDSQVVVEKLRRHGVLEAFDLEGGLHQWSKTVDPIFPLY